MKEEDYKELKTQVPLIKWNLPPIITHRSVPKDQVWLVDENKGVIFKIVNLEEESPHD